MGTTNKNWNGSVIYQIYPRSFKDSNNDGIGDLKGITQKLEYLKGKPGSLGIDIIWISPFYPSPMADFGYDITDYKNIDSIFGDIVDFKNLLKKAHKLNLKVIIDFVPNHTSDEHPWFKESKGSKSNPKRDWYIWKPPKKDGEPPNNWQSVFGGSAWHLDKNTGEYYLHSFHRKQPDLNWDNPEVVDAMQENLRFWLDLGVDGFRVDAISWISKDSKVRNDKMSDSSQFRVNSYDHLMHDKSMHYTELFERISQINKTVNEYSDKFVLYEYYANHWSVNTYEKFYSNTDSSISAPFNFTLINEPWSYGSLVNYIDSFLQKLKPNNIPVFCFGNHDSLRVIDRLGERSAKQAAFMILTLPGMPTIYYGDELGMHAEYVAKDNVQDPFEKQQPAKNLGRDPSRATMHWNKTQNHGFSEHQAWLKSFESYPSQAYFTELKNPKSFYNLYRKLIHLRKASEALSLGKYKPFYSKNEVFGYYRTTQKEKYLILHNISASSKSVYKNNLVGRTKISTHTLTSKPISGRIMLKPYESIVIKLKTK